MRSKLAIISFSFIIALCCTNCLIAVDSQLIYVPSEVGLVTILPPIENYNLSMTQANIKITAEMRDVGDFIIPLTFDSNYSILNPDSTKSITVVIPYNEDYEWGFSNLDIRINEIKVYEEECEDDFRRELNDEFHDYNFRCLNNVVFPGNSTTIIRIQSTNIISIPPLRFPVNFSILHDVLTANYWKGNISGSVEINVNGYLPFEYSNYSYLTPERKCQVIHKENGSVYFWEWENERIKEENVYVKWMIDRNKPFTFLAESEWIAAFASVVISSFILYKLGFLRKKKWGWKNE